MRRRGRIDTRGDFVIRERLRLRYHGQCGPGRARPASLIGCRSMSPPCDCRTRPWARAIYATCFQSIVWLARLLSRGPGGWRGRESGAQWRRGRGDVGIKAKLELCPPRRPPRCAAMIPRPWPCVTHSKLTANARCAATCHAKGVTRSRGNRRVTRPVDGGC